MSFVTDTMTGTLATALPSHTGELGATWSVHPASASNNVQISGANRAMPTATGISLYTASGTPINADYDVSCVIFPRSIAGIAGVVGRVHATDNTFYTARYQAATTAWDLVKIVAGAATTLGSFTQTLTLDTGYTVKLEMRGSDIKLYVDTVLRVTGSDNAITGAGKAGIRTSGFAGGSSTGLHLDTFDATDAPAIGSAGKMRMVI